MSKALRYRRSALLADHVRAGVGVVLPGAPLLFVAPNPATIAVLGGLAGLFALFGVRTALRHAIAVEIDERGLALVGPFGSRIDWRDLNLFKLGYYTTRRDRQGGWMQLTLRGKGRRMKIDSTLDGFEDVVRVAMHAALDNDIDIAATTLANLAALNIVVPDETARSRS